MTGQEARDDEREALIAEAKHILDSIGEGDWTRQDAIMAWLIDDLARKHPEPEIAAREDVADFPVGTIARDMIGRVFVRTDAQTYRWRTILGGGYDLSDDQATTYTPVRILWVPVGEGEQPKPKATLVDERDAACVAAWPGCGSGEYDPRCCRFPKSCSAGIIRLVTPGEGEQG